LWLARKRGNIEPDRLFALLEEVAELPSKMEDVMARSGEVKSVARDYIHSRSMLYLGRGLSYPMALEGALKLKEISYIHAEGYPAGELKHGPLALVDDDMPVVAVAPGDDLLEKVLSNLEEVRARGGQLIVFGDQDTVGEVDDMTFVSMPNCHPIISPIVYAIPMQLLSYHVAVFKGTDVDQPRNLAKSVTVE
ncbi:MAG: SIS domain-containing protein, partial [Gammaproteobacteria bacterium]|nr:SIS domain-containing protein [Gammaproteobacteria bacterium]